jgi:hypothetical protein
LYRSTALILLEPQQVPEAYVRSTVSTSLEQRLQSISQQILTRTTLERIIQEFDLYPEELTNPKGASHPSGIGSAQVDRSRRWTLESLVARLAAQSPVSGRVPSRVRSDVVERAANR